MFSLTYSAAYDPYHSVFRFISLFRFVDHGAPVDFESVRIADFYHSFPWLLADFSAYAKIAGFQKDKNQVVRAYPKTRFDRLPDNRLVFQRMLASQFAAKSALLKNGDWISDGEALTSTPLAAHNQPLASAVDKYCEKNTELLRFLGEKLISVPLLGPGGLKERSGLGEFRYDVI
jgi:hypothetical protein